MKKIRRFLNRQQSSASNMVFAVKKITHNGSTSYLPVARTKGIFSDWIPIVKIEHGEYYLLPIEVQGLSDEKCREIISGYKEQLGKEDAKKTYSEHFEIVK